jgi:hypothetical protein
MPFRRCARRRGGGRSGTVRGACQKSTARPDHAIAPRVGLLQTTRAAEPSQLGGRVGGTLCPQRTTPNRTLETKGGEENLHLHRISLILARMIRGSNFTFEIVAILRKQILRCELPFCIARKGESFAKLNLQCALNSAARVAVNRVGPGRPQYAPQLHFRFQLRTALIPAGSGQRQQAAAKIRD